MYKYFEQLQISISKKVISKDAVAKYKEQVILYLYESGATESDIKLVNDEMIETSIRNNHIPEETAWAILQ